MSVVRDKISRELIEQSILVHAHYAHLVECRFTFTETVGLLGTGTQDVHLDFHTAPEL